MNGFPTTNESVRSSAILRRTRSNATCIIARSEITELIN